MQSDPNPHENEAPEPQPGTGTPHVLLEPLLEENVIQYAELLQKEIHERWEYANVIDSRDVMVNNVFRNFSQGTLLLGCVLELKLRVTLREFKHYVNHTMNPFYESLLKDTIYTVVVELEKLADQNQVLTVVLATDFKEVIIKNWKTGGTFFDDPSKACAEAMRTFPTLKLVFPPSATLKRNTYTPLESISNHHWFVAQKLLNITFVGGFTFPPFDVPDLVPAPRTRRAKRKQIVDSDEEGDGKAADPEASGQAAQPEAGDQAAPPPSSSANDDDGPAKTRQANTADPPRAADKGAPPVRPRVDMQNPHHQGYMRFMASPLALRRIRAKRKALRRPKPQKAQNKTGGTSTTVMDLVRANIGHPGKLLQAFASKRGVLEGCLRAMVNEGLIRDKDADPPLNPKEVQEAVLASAVHFRLAELGQDTEEGEALLSDLSAQMQTLEHDYLTMISENAGAARSRRIWLLAHLDTFPIWVKSPFKCLCAKIQSEISPVMHELLAAASSQATKPSLSVDDLLTLLHATAQSASSPPPQQQQQQQQDEEAQASGSQPEPSVEAIHIAVHHTVSLLLAWHATRIVTTLEWLPVFLRLKANPVTAAFVTPQVLLLYRLKHDHRELRRLAEHFLSDRCRLRREPVPYTALATLQWTVPSV